MNKKVIKDIYLNNDNDDKIVIMNKNYIFRIIQIFPVANFFELYFLKHLNVLSILII